MSQEHIFKATELCLQAQEQAVRLWPVAGTPGIAGIAESGER
jgi:hypothetical protein